VLEAALITIVRKAIILEPNEISGLTILAIAALILALALGRVCKVETDAELASQVTQNWVELTCLALEIGISWSIHGLGSGLWGIVSPVDLCVDIVLFSGRIVHCERQVVHSVVWAH